MSETDVVAAIQIIEHNITNKTKELTKEREELKEMYYKLLTITENLNAFIGNFDSGWKEIGSR